MLINPEASTDSDDAYLAAIAAAWEPDNLLSGEDRAGTGFRPVDIDAALYREIFGDDDHDQFLGDEERSMECLTQSDLAWAAENLDPLS